MRSSESLVRHAAAQLGAATYNANNYKEEHPQEDGSSLTSPTGKSI